MKIKDIILPGLVILGIIALVVVFAKSPTKEQSSSTSSTSSTASNSSTPYFDESAPVMYFFSDGCSWCQKEKSVLEELAKEGYRVKPMNVGEHQEYWKDYDISGTPTFMAPDKAKLAGYQDKEELKKFLDKYKNLPPAATEP